MKDTSINFTSRTKGRAGTQTFLRDCFFMQTNENLILNAIHNSWLTALAFHYKAKATFTNSCFYSHTLRETATKLNVSYGTVRNNIKILEEKGLVRTHTGNIIFVSHSDTILKYSFSKKDKHECLITVNKTDSLKKIKHELRLKILQYLKRHQEKAISDKCEAKILDAKLNSPNTFPTVREIKKRDKIRHLLESKINLKVTFTDAYLSKKLCCSLSQITQFKKAVADRIKIIRHKPQKLFLILYSCFQNDYKMLVKQHGKGLFFYNGYLFQSQPTEYRNMVATSSKEVVTFLNKNA